MTAADPLTSGSTPGDADPISVVARFYQAMADRDRQAMLELLDPAVVLTQDERLPWGGRYEGHDGFVTRAKLSAVDSAVTTEAMFEADGTVVQAGRTRGTVRATGQPFDIAEVHRWTVRNGRVVAAHFSIDTPAMLRALGATTSG